MQRASGTGGFDSRRRQTGIAGIKHRGKNMKETISGVRYDTDKAAMLASNYYWDGSNFERGGRNTYLYRGQNGGYFIYYTTQWQGECNYIEPIRKDDAKRLYDSLREKGESWEAAFDEVPVEA